MPAPCYKEASPRLQNHQFLQLPFLRTNSTVPFQTLVLSLVRFRTTLVAMAEQFQQAKDTAGQKTQETSQWTQDKAGEVGDAAKDAAQYGQDKAGEAGKAGQDTWEQSKQGTGDASTNAQQKAEEAKDKAGNIIQQATDKVKEAFSSNK